jgi:hypothetical protein
MARLPHRTSATPERCGVVRRPSPVGDGDARHQSQQRGGDSMCSTASPSPPASSTQCVPSGARHDRPRMPRHAWQLADGPRPRPRASSPKSNAIGYPAPDALGAVVVVDEPATVCLNLGGDPRVIGCDRPSPTRAGHHHRSQMGPPGHIGRIDGQTAGLARTERSARAAVPPGVTFPLRSRSNPQAWRGNRPSRQLGSPAEPSPTRL